MLPGLFTVRFVELCQSRIFYERIKAAAKGFDRDCGGKSE